MKDRASIKKAAKRLSEAGAAKGGRARADKLTAERRSEIAREAAMARWGFSERPNVATHTGVLRIGGVEIDCAVLQDGRRVISQRALDRALGRKFGGKEYRRRESAGAGHIPISLVSHSLKPFISEDLMELVGPVPYRHLKAGGKVALGVDAAALPKILEVWLNAREAGALKPSQLRIARQAELLMRGLAHTGIIALVDEATGFQYDRARQALAEILEQFIAKELAAWAKRFPNSYYKELFRLRGWTYDEVSTKRPPIIGKLTKGIVYQRLAPGVLDELERKNPRENGSRRARHHQWLTDDVGHPKLREHLKVVEALMKISPDYETFMNHLDLAVPKFGSTLKLPFYDTPTTDSGEDE